MDAPSAPIAHDMTPDSNDSPTHKESREFYNLLNDYYLKVETNSYNKLKLVCYNKKLLDNIRYETKISIDSLYQICPTFKAYDLKHIYEIIIKIIEDGKFEINKKNDDLFFYIMITDPLGNQMKVSFKLNNNTSNKKDEFLDALSKEVILLRKQKEDLEEIKNEQNEFKKEIEEINKLV